MDEGLSAAVRRVFVRLYREGLIYRGTRLVNWDPKAQSTLSDAEVENVERDGTLWHMRYPFASDDRGDGIEVATTRPETMLGDVAVAVHPNDERYAQLIGRHVSCRRCSSARFRSSPTRRSIASSAPAPSR